MGTIQLLNLHGHMHKRVGVGDLTIGRLSNLESERVENRKNEKTTVTPPRWRV